MKAEIHPKWYPEALVTCACGTTFTVGTTVPKIARTNRSAATGCTMGSPAALVYRTQPYGLLSGIGVLGFVLCTAVGIWVYAVVNRRFGPSGFDNETRCRKCGYILRGIPEPRCSECGERI